MSPLSAADIQTLIIDKLNFKRQIMMGMGVNSNKESQDSEHVSLRQNQSHTNTPLNISSFSPLKCGEILISNVDLSSESGEISDESSNHNELFHSS